MLEHSHADQPLTLTVHSLPCADALVSRRRIQGRWMMLSILAACAAPVIMSYLTYYFMRPQASKNYGQLIEPVRPLPSIPARLIDGTTISLAALRGQWLLVSVGDARCDAVCERHIYLSRQLREVTGRDRDRIERVWLVTDEAPVAAALAAQAHAPQLDAQALRVPRVALAQWLEPATGQGLDDHLYLVDPHGNWMLRWPAQIDANKAKRDLLQLLRASSSWDQAGRPSMVLRSPSAPPELPPSAGGSAPTVKP